MNKKLVYVDTDVSLGTPGAEIDDGAALIFLLRNQAIKVVGAGSVFGNVPVQDATINLDRLLIALDYDHIPLAPGVDKPLKSDMAWFEEWQSKYGQTFPWNTRPTSISAASLIVHTVCDNPGEISILALGPMTNLALAIQIEPAIISLTHEVIVMGGSFNRQNPAPEFNVRCDAEAAQMVFNAGWSVHVLGLDITRQVHFSRKEFTSLPDGNPAVELLRLQAPGWIDRMEEMGWDYDGCALHDAVAAVYLAERTIFQVEQANVDVELVVHNSRGATQFSAPTKGKPVVTAVTGVDAKKCRDFIWSYLQS